MLHLKVKLVEMINLAVLGGVWSQCLDTGILAQAMLQSKQQEGPSKALPVQFAQELERQKIAQSKWDGPQNGNWPHDMQARSFVQNGFTFGAAHMPVSLPFPRSQDCVLECA